MHVLLFYCCAPRGRDMTATTPATWQRSPLHHPRHVDILARCQLLFPLRCRSPNKSSFLLYPNITSFSLCLQLRSLLPRSNVLVYGGVEGLVFDSLVVREASDLRGPVDTARWYSFSPLSFAPALFLSLSSRVGFLEIFASDGGNW
jgi:hypothetical protein